MRHLDYIIVGCGIAGIAICERLEADSKSFVVFDSGVYSATSVAGGVVNPMVLKRLNPVWKAAQFLNTARPFYEGLQKKLNTNILADQPLLRIFTTAEEQNDWTVASDSPAMEQFLLPEIIKNTNNNIFAPLGYGAVRNSFRIDTTSLLKSYKNDLQSSGNLIGEEFDYNELKETNDGFVYRDISTRYVIFAEGSAVLKNPWFTLDSIIPKKGEYLLIRSRELKCTSTLKGPYFMIPTEDDLYMVGATFAHGDFSYDKTVKGRQTLEEAIQKMVKCPYEVVDQICGMRPTVKDRRPLIGSLNTNGIYFLNGLGTRGLLMAPLLSQWLYQLIENNAALPSEVDIRRFSN
ncbi:NAD(P)/FAD-dependent oxidoreductase [Pukyongia salina]|uniref:NAD(P)/FAD-dependent oxidoreductase n=1 Tax=Pukyongia salina TaxID=2094025 RepID=UPI001319F3EA|nr:FAD-dependent oxidoreductase [Pukyongia salina]